MVIFQVYAAVAIKFTHLDPLITAQLCNLLSIKDAVPPKMARPVA